MAVKLKGPENHGGFTFRGESFEPDENGHIDVPHEALDEAFSHGFSIVPEQAESKGDGAEGKAVKLSKLTKEQLAAFAKETLDLELDLSKTAKALIEEIEAAQAAKLAAA